MARLLELADAPGEPSERDMGGQPESIDEMDAESLITMVLGNTEFDRASKGM